MRITKLDGLRGIFSIMVVFTHYDEAKLPAYIFNNFLIREAYIFVDFFFVLSGYVITYNYNLIKTRGEVWLYLRKRFIRLYPLLFHTTVVYLLAEVVLNVFLPQFQNTPNSIEGLLYKTIDTLSFLNSTPLLPNNGLGMNYPSWSISSEMISYTVFGMVSLYFIGKRKSIVMLSLVLASMMYCIWSGYFFHTAGYGFVRGLLSFNLGYFVWFFSQKNFRFKNRLEYLNLALLIVVFYLLYTHEGIQKQIIGLLLVPLFFGASILTFLKSDGAISRILESGPLQFLGRISYSVYLNHAIIILVVPRGIFELLNFKQSPLSQIIVLLLTTIALVVYSQFTYKYVELIGGKTLRERLL